MWSSRAQNCIICPYGWLVFGDHCFNFFPGSYNFTTALSTCKNNNSTMVMISSDTDFIWAQSLHRHYAWDYWVIMTSNEIDNAF